MKQTAPNVISRIKLKAVHFVESGGSWLSEITYSNAIKLTIASWILYIVFRNGGRPGESKRPNVETRRYGI